MRATEVKTVWVPLRRMTLRSTSATLYEGPGPTADRFRYGLLAFDLATVTWLVASSFFPRPHTTAIDVTIGLVFLADFLAGSGPRAAP